jgi:hypothetical protein
VLFGLPALQNDTPLVGLPRAYVIA